MQSQYTQDKEEEGNRGGVELKQVGDEGRREEEKVVDNPVDTEKTIGVENSGVENLSTDISDNSADQEGGPGTITPVNNSSSTLTTGALEDGSQEEKEQGSGSCIETSRKIKPLTVTKLDKAKRLKKKTAQKRPNPPNRKSERLRDGPAAKKVWLYP